MLGLLPPAMNEAQEGRKRLYVAGIGGFRAVPHCKGEGNIRRARPGEENKQKASGREDQKKDFGILAQS
jgi:hypothetical protein